MRQLAKEAALAQESDEVFAAEVKKGPGRPKGKGKGPGRGKGKGKGRKGKGRGRGKAGRIEQEQLEEETGNYTNDLDEDQDQGHEHTTSLTSPRPAAIRRLAFLRSKSRSSSLGQGKSKSPIEAMPTKRKLDFQDGQQPVPANSKRRKCEHTEQGPIARCSRKRKSPADPVASPTEKNQPESDPRQDAKERPTYLFLCIRSVIWLNSGINLMTPH